MEEVRVVLLGRIGAGKSSAGNTLLGSKSFHTESSPQGVTQTCSTSTRTTDGQRVCVVDTPGWTDLIQMDDKTILEIARCIDLSEPGPHVFFLVLPIGRFTKEEINTVNQILEVFGEEARKYTMVLFTKGDDLEENIIEVYLKGVHPDLKKILDDCGGRYHVFNNKDKENHQQVSYLLEKIKLMVEGNTGKYYTKAMYQKTADLMEKKWKMQKVMNKMMEEECRKQANNSAVGSNDDAMFRKTPEQNNSFKTEGTDSAENKEGESQRVVKKQIQDRMSYCKQNTNPMHGDIKHKQSQNNVNKLENHRNDFSEMEMQCMQMVQRFCKLEMETWLKEKDELKEQIQQLQNDVKNIYSMIN